MPDDDARQARRPPGLAPFVQGAAVAAEPRELLARKTQAMAGTTRRCRSVTRSGRTHLEVEVCAPCAADTDGVPALRERPGQRGEGRTNRARCVTRTRSGVNERHRPESVHDLRRGQLTAGRGA